MSDIRSFDVGDTVRFAAAFTTTDGVDDDPSTITLKVKAPSGVETSYVYLTDGSLVRDSEGHYHRDVGVAAAGTWHYRWIGTGDVATADEGRIVVRRSAFTTP